jgi:hypothetical protein
LIKRKNDKEERDWPPKRVSRSIEHNVPRFLSNPPTHHPYHIMGKKGKETKKEEKLMERG